MSAKKRTYKFNWLDHLYYTGKGGPAQWGMWFYIEGFFVLTPLVLLSLCMIVMAGEQTVNTVLLRTAILAACSLAVVLFSKWLLKKHYFTPQRERVYFHRYPRRKDYPYPFYIVIMAFLTSGTLGGFLIFYILKWIDNSTT